MRPFSNPEFVVYIALPCYIVVRRSNHCLLSLNLLLSLFRLLSLVSRDRKPRRYFFKAVNN